VNFHVAIPFRSGRAGVTSDRLVEIHDGLFSRNLAEGDVLQVINYRDGLRIVLIGTDWHGSENSKSSDNLFNPN
jgi:hypothetical protein